MKTNLVAFSIAGAAVSFLGLFSPALAYDVTTHAAMSLRAFERSGIGQFSNVPSTLARLGLVELHNLREALPSEKDIFGARYYDFGGLARTERFAGSPGFVPANDYEAKRFQWAQIGGHYLTLGGWLARGAIREDDHPFDPEIPKDDACWQREQPTCIRVMNQFFDPYNNRAFNSATDSLAEKSPDWAIGTTNAFASIVMPNATRANRFSVFDARDVMYSALTLREKAQGGVGYVDIFPSGYGADAEKEQAQKSYWATTFRALGDLVHHVQDMAQPQHTRGDAHGADKYDAALRNLLGHKSFYESYVDARIQQKAVLLPNDVRRSVPSLLIASNEYGVIPRFNRYADYWSTAPGSGSLTGRGMADYSNRGFYTAKTNVGSGAVYLEPSQNVSPAQLEESSNLTDMGGEPLGGSVRFVIGSVTDTLVPDQTKPGVRLSSLSLFDQFLIDSGKPATYNLNKYNFDAMAELLVPRP